MRKRTLVLAGCAALLALAAAIYSYAARPTPAEAVSRESARRADAHLAKPPERTDDAIRAELPALIAAVRERLRGQAAALQLSVADVDALATSSAELVTLHRTGDLAGYEAFLKRHNLLLPPRWRQPGADIAFRRAWIGFVGHALALGDTRVRLAADDGVVAQVRLDPPIIAVAGTTLAQPGERGPADLDVLGGKLDVVEVSVATERPRTEGRVNRFGVGFARRPGADDWVPVSTSKQNFVLSDYYDAAIQLPR